MPQPISPELVAAYRDTHYRVDGPDGQFTLRVDRESPELRDLLARKAASSAAFLTAWNPYSEQRTRDANDAAQHQLVEEARAAAFEVLPGFGEDPAGIWPGEESVLVIGMDETAARAMAARYGQHAFLHCGPDAVPRLTIVAQ